LHNLIVGFPGETDEHFEHLLQFVRHEFDHVGVFFTGGGNPAYKLPNHLPQDIMDARRTPNGSPAADFPEKNQAEVGKVVDVLIEQENPETGELMVALLGFRRRWMV